MEKYINISEESEANHFSSWLKLSSQALCGGGRQILLLDGAVERQKKLGDMAKKKNFIPSKQKAGPYQGTLRKQMSKFSYQY